MRVIKDSAMNCFHSQLRAEMLSALLTDGRKAAGYNPPPPPVTRIFTATYGQRMPPGQTGYRPAEMQRKKQARSITEIESTTSIQRNL
jgi:hypothetical protein